MSVEKRRAAAWGLVATAALAALIVLGSACLALNAGLLHYLRRLEQASVQATRG
ncbi:MAG TPA: hypothetical protein VFD38_14910 [Myxococcaceae bacterium]|nr:hypothetical protein [Myxococcaceae bacterium]